MSVIFSNDSLLALFVSIMTVMAITLIFKTSTTTNFAQTTIATFGCYLVAKIMYEAHVNIWVSTLIGFVICMLIGIFIDVGVIRHARHVNPVGKQIITMGFTYILLSIISFAVQIKTPAGTIVQVNPATALIPITKEVGGQIVNVGFNVGNIFYSWNTVVCVIIAVVLIAALYIAIYLTKWGLGVRMTASNETTAQMMGVNTHVITAASWSIAAGLGCLACVFINNANGKLSTSIMTSVQLAAFLGCIVGGFNTFWGPAVAAAIIWLAGSLVNVLGMYVGSEIVNWKDVIVYGVAMILVLIRPTGLFGKAARKKV